MITFSAVVNIVLFSSLSILLLSFVFRDNKAVLRLDIRFLPVCMLLILFRLLIPIESPLTKDIPISHIYPDIYMFLKEPFYTAGIIQVSILWILKFVWFTGAGVQLLKVAQTYYGLMRTIGSYQRSTDERVFRIMEEIQEERRLKIAFRIVSTEHVKTPFVFGIIRPRIVIPVMDFSEEELYFILKHEMLHFYRGDLLVKLFSEILRAVYWWNPIVIVLEKLIDNMQEINVDFRIMKDLPDEKKLDYSECLVEVAKRRGAEEESRRWIAAFENSSTMHKRISLMLDNMDISKRKTVASVALSAVILSLVVLCPNILIFEPYAISEEDEEGTFDIKEDNYYYLKNSSGAFDLYLNGEYIATITELLNEDIEVYSSHEEAEKDLR